MHKTMFNAFRRERTFSPSLPAGVLRRFRKPASPRTDTKRKLLKASCLSSILHFQSKTSEEGGGILIRRSSARSFITNCITCAIRWVLYRPPSAQLWRAMPAYRAKKGPDRQNNAAQASQPHSSA